MGNSVAIPHIFGTVALLTMFFTVGTYYNGFFTTLNEEAYRAQMGQVSEYLSSNLIDLVVLSRLSEGDLFLVKTIDVPLEIGDRFYRISLEEMQSPLGEDLLKVVSEIESLDIYSTADLPWPKSTYMQIYTNQSISTRYGDSIEIRANITSNGVERRMAETGEPATLVVWCHKTDDVTIIGLGVLDRVEGGGG
ncbi:MAG: hypothetical protein ACLFVP_08010 [Candidatus Bathyarchaeia archaeon]